MSVSQMNLKVKIIPGTANSKSMEALQRNMYVWNPALHGLQYGRGIYGGRDNERLEGRITIVSFFVHSLSVNDWE